MRLIAHPPIEEAESKISTGDGFVDIEMGSMRRASSN